MSEKFRNKFRNGSIRLQNWDYRWKGAYFITICTKNRDHYFGNVIDGKMVVSPIGAIADICWYEIKNHAKNIQLGEYVIMPNHMHGVLILTNGPDETAVSNERGEQDGDVPSSVSIPMMVPMVGARHALRLPPPPVLPAPETVPISSSIIYPKTIGQQRFQNQGKNSVSSIVGGYKSAVTKHARRLGFDFYWQPRFYNHIIRNDKSFENISNYIRNNPANWGDDKFCGN